MNADSKVPEVLVFTTVESEIKLDPNTTDLDELIQQYLFLLDEYSTVQSNAGVAFSRVSEEGNL